MCVCVCVCVCVVKRSAFNIEKAVGDINSIYVISWGNWQALPSVYFFMSQPNLDGKALLV